MSWLLSWSPSHHPVAAPLAQRRWRPPRKIPNSTSSSTQVSFVPSIDIMVLWWWLSSVIPDLYKESRSSRGGSSPHRDAFPAVQITQIPQMTPTELATMLRERLDSTWWRGDFGCQVMILCCTLVNIESTIMGLWVIENWPYYPQRKRTCCLIEKLQMPVHLKDGSTSDIGQWTIGCRLCTVSRQLSIVQHY